MFSPGFFLLGDIVKLITKINLHREKADTKN